MMRTILAMIAVLALATVAQAAVVNLFIEAEIGSGGGTWEVRASVVGTGVEGISDFGIDVVGTDGLTVDSSLNEAPHGVNPAGVTLPYRWWGFCEMRSDGNNGVGIVANQPSIYAGGPDPDKDTLVVQRFGQDAGSRTCFVNGLITWDADILLASGTYVGDVGWLTVTGIGWNLLESGGSPWTGPGNLGAPEWVNPPPVYIPEPATMVLLGLGGLALIRRRRGNRGR